MVDQVAADPLPRAQTPVQDQCLSWPRAYLGKRGLDFVAQNHTWPCSDNVAWTFGDIACSMFPRKFNAHHGARKPAEGIALA